MRSPSRPTLPSPWPQHSHESPQLEEGPERNVVPGLLAFWRIRERWILSGKQPLRRAITIADVPWYNRRALGG